MSRVDCGQELNEPRCAGSRSRRKLSASWAQKSRRKVQKWPEASISARRRRHQVVTLGEQNVVNTRYRSAPAQPPRFPRSGHSGLGSRAAAVTLPGISVTAQTTKGQTKMQATMEHYKPPVRFGLGGVPLG